MRVQTGNNKALNGLITHSTDSTALIQAHFSQTAHNSQNNDLNMDSMARAGTM
jgi:hypothetical protein